MPDSRVSAFATSVCYEVGIIKKEKCFDAKTFKFLDSLRLDNVLKRYIDLRINECFLKIVCISGEYKSVTKIREV